MRSSIFGIIPSQQQVSASGTNSGGGISYNGDAAATLDQVSRADKAEYDQVYRPLNQQMIAAVNSTSLVDAAKGSANKGFDSAKAREGRMAERYGINFSALQQTESGHQSNAKRGLNYDYTLNTARMNQYERNVGVRNDMIAVGRGIDASAYKQLSNSANLQTHRENANRQAQAQANASQSQMMGSMVSAGMMAIAFL